MRIVLLSALLWLAILISLTTTDIFSRDWTPVPATWESSLLRLPRCRHTRCTGGSVVEKPPTLVRAADFGPLGGQAANRKPQ